LYLKRLDLIGFKSFANKTRLEFPPGITAIVGPNGSGKSNLVDAVLWVLGEHNVRNLRGERSEDIIFAGSDAKRRLGMAQVDLTIDNSSQLLPVEFDEVTVTRKLFRSGESKFYINQSSCRLKDIYELFLDTGVGRDAYSIVTQSEIDAVVAATPEERREFIEEVAGIKRYRFRKKETLRKLEAVERNLQRVTDILSEIEPRLEPLKKQAEDAARYNEVAEGLAEKERSLLLADIKRLTKITDEVALRRSQLEAELASLERDLADLGEQAAKTKQESIEVEAGIETLRDDLTECTRRLDQAEAQAAVQGQEARSQRREAARLESEAHAASAKARDLRLESDRLSELKERLESERQQAQLDVESATAELRELDPLSPELWADDSREAPQREEITQRLSRARSELEAVVARSAALQETSARLERELEDLTLRKAKAAGALEERQSAHSRVVERLAQMRASADAATAERETVSVKVQELSVELERARESLAAKQSRLDALIDLRGSLEGFALGPKNVLSAAGTGRLMGSYLPVADILKVNEEKELAVEAALGPSLQYIVCEDEEQAKEAIEFLKEVRGGRATFMPVTSVKERQHQRIAGDILASRGVVGVAADAVECEPQFAPIVDFLLGRVLLVEDIDAGIAVARSQPRAWSKLVTLDGEVFYPSGTLTGGWWARKTERSTLLSRGAQIEELTKQVEEIQRQIDEYSGDLVDSRSVLVQAQGTADESRDSLESLVVEQERTASGLEFLRGELTEIETAAASASQERERTGNELASVEGRKSELSQEVGRLEAALSAMAAARPDAEAQRKRNQLSARLSDARVTAASLAERIQSTEESLRRVESESQEAAQRAESAQRQADETRKAADETDETAKQQDSSRQAEAERREAIDSRLREARARRVELAQRLSECEQEQRRLERKKDEITGESHELDLRETQSKVSLEAARERLAEEYEVEPEDLRLDEIEIPEDLEKVRREVRTLSREVRRMGIVNLGALEEYNRLRERHGFLTKESADLLESRESLSEAMKEIDEATKESFMAVFDRVGESFSKMFTRVFGGGTCSLELTDPGNLLETGVDVQVQLPGKKACKMVVLSGGERALTAIALTFALLDVKPSPFCILDELDAPLDDANVGQFLTILQDFAKHTQFIVVTHNRQTMAAADALYGVAMETPGTSKLVSVRLE
jgi:chromosome segregation protein